MPVTTIQEINQRFFDEIRSVRCFAHICFCVITDDECDLAQLTPLTDQSGLVSPERFIRICNVTLRLKAVSVLSTG